MDQKIVQEELFNHFFGTEAIEYEQLLDSILLCSKLEKFDALNIDMNSPRIDKIFARAATKTESGLSSTRSKELFVKLKTVRSNVEFI